MPRVRLWGPLLATAAVLAVAGCSMARFGYDALPVWLHWQIERYLDLDEAQREIVSRRLDELLHWHRRTQLPRYAEFLREVDAEIAGGVDAPRIGRWREQVGEAWETLAERLAPGVAELALTLRPEQIARLRERLDDANATARETLLPSGEGARERARLERVIKRAEFLLGRLGRAQVRALRPAIDALPPDEELWLVEREARQHHLLALLNRLQRDRPSRAEATRQCREFLATFWQSRDARRRHRLERGIEAGDALSARIFADATPKQREHLSKLLRGFAEDFESLSRKASQDRQADATR